MYSKRAKYKQVANIDWLGIEVMELIAYNHMDREKMDDWIHADYYWLPGIGLYVIIDVKEKDIQNSYKGYKQLWSRDDSQEENYGRFICSNE